jgi:hypothetical protein
MESEPERQARDKTLASRSGSDESLGSDERTLWFANAGPVEAKLLPPPVRESSLT